MSWNRTTVATALVSTLQAAVVPPTTVHPKPPFTLNPPAVVVGRVASVVYATAGLSVDEVTIPLTCVGGMDDDDGVNTLAEVVRAAIVANQSLGGAVVAAWPTEQRNWRALNVGGADLLACDITLTVHA